MSLYYLFVAAFISLTNAQSPASSSLEPLASKHFTYPNLPYQVTGDRGGGRGPQAGYNLCNSSTEGSSSMCQTLFLNSISDFCMWSSPKPNDFVGQSEAYEVAWCTKPGHGSRIIPDGAIKSAQWLYAKNYVQVVGYIDQTQVNLLADDEGGELDPHGADEQGNPLGGIVFTNAFGQNSASFAQQFSSHSNGTSNYTQVIEWVDFIGSGIFCLKMCSPSDPNAPNLCQHIYDEIGCAYNVLADYAAINSSGTFQVCDSDDMTPPGVFTTAPGATTTWFQPIGGAVGVPPYTPSIPASSNCQTYASTQLFATATASATSGSNSGNSGSGSSRSGSVASPSATGGSNDAVALYSTLAMVIAVMLGAVVTLMA